MEKSLKDIGIAIGFGAKDTAAIALITVGTDFIMAGRTEGAFLILLGALLLVVDRLLE